MNKLVTSLAFLLIVPSKIVSSVKLKLLNEFTFNNYLYYFKLSNENEEECLRLFTAQIKPRVCCNFPLRFILPLHQEKCKKSCEKIKDGSAACCFLDCNYHKTGVVRNFKLDKNALLELYENYLNDKGAGKFDRWLLTVEESIKTCVRLSK